MCVNSPVSTSSGSCPYTTCCIMSSGGDSHFCECFDASFLTAFGNTCRIVSTFEWGRATPTCTSRHVARPEQAREPYSNNAPPRGPDRRPAGEGSSPPWWAANRSMNG
jgi:hypothetical protein